MKSFLKILLDDTDVSVFRSIMCNPCTTVMGELITGHYKCVTAGGTWEITVPSLHFCCEPKTALKYKVYLKKKKSSLITQKDLPYGIPVASRMCLTQYLHIWVVGGKKPQATNIIPFRSYKWDPGWPSAILYVLFEHKWVQEREFGWIWTHLPHHWVPRCCMKEKKKQDTWNTQSWALVTMLFLIISIMLSKICFQQASVSSPVGQSHCHLPTGNAVRSNEVTIAQWKWQ